MGNCLKHQSSSSRDNDDDWSFQGDDDEGAFAGTNIVASAAKPTITEVKIKITKKQLEELLRKVDVRELRVEQVLSQLMNHSGGYQSLQRSWRPALQSIPELN